MTGKKTAVFGIYQDANQAEHSVDCLVAAGFTKNTKAPEGTTTGVTAGGAIGGTLGLLAGIGALAIPGLSPFIAAGPIMSALAGLGVGGAVGGLIGALIGMGIPEYEAKRYEGRIKDGGVLLSAHCDTSEEIARAKDLLKHTGAQDISSSGEARADHPAASKVAAH
jgi:tetrahydromethanopterin S-methyltransferase subunit C